MQWHQLDRIQTICTSPQTVKHTNTSSLNFCSPDALPDAQPTVSKHWRQCDSVRISGNYTGWAKKQGHRLVTIILSILNRFKNFLLEGSLLNLQLNGHQKSHRTLHMLLHSLVKHLSAKQTINDNLQGSVATYLRRGGVYNNKIKKGLLVSLWVKKC